VITLTKEQKVAHDTVLDFLKVRGELLTIGGFGGTGKTTTVGVVTETLKKQGKNLALVTLTGKAASVIKPRVEHIVTDNDYCGTIHGLMYRLTRTETIKLRNNETREELFFEKRGEHLPYHLIIVDEASMVNEQIYNDLLSYGIPILAVGDHGQLPPIEGQFSLMEDPHIRLETIMRQVADNPIIKVATMARETGKIPYGVFGDGVKKIGNFGATRDHDYDNPNAMMLCRTNQSRVSYIKEAREQLGFDGEAKPGEWVMCLSNDLRAGVYNGSIGRLIEIENTNDEEIQALKVDFDGNVYETLAIKEQWWRRYNGTLQQGVARFTWAYAATVHKAQGSEWDHITVVEDKMIGMSDEEWRRWLYTAVSRAKETLTVIG